jgi:hypothetical protein
MFLFKAAGDQRTDLNTALYVKLTQQYVLEYISLYMMVRG